MESNQQSKALIKATNSWNTSQNPKMQELEKQQDLIDHEKNLVLKPNYTINTNGKRVRVDDNFVFPPGYRFCPHDEELILHYLKKKVMNEFLPHDKIKEVNLYRHSPQELSENYSVLGEKEWYFFTPRDRKYPNGDRPNRAAGTGYWKATGADKHIIQNGVTIGFRKALVFYEGKPPKGDKTNWIMHEFRVNESRRLKTHASDMRLDDWVLCRIYKKVDKSSLIKAPRKEEEEEEEHDQEIAGKCDSPVAKVENCDYEEPIDSFARQQFDTPHQYNTDPNYPYFMINNPDCFSDYGARLPNYGVNLPSFPPGNMLGSCQGQESNIFKYYQNHYGGEIDYHNVLNIVGVLEENSSIVGVLDENLSMFGVLDENSSIDKN